MRVFALLLVSFALSLKFPGSAKAQSDLIPPTFTLSATAFGRTQIVIENFQAFCFNMAAALPSNFVFKVQYNGGELPEGLRCTFRGSSRDMGCNDLNLEVDVPRSGPVTLPVGVLSGLIECSQKQPNWLCNWLGWLWFC
jgi:hypothetical protein